MEICQYHALTASQSALLGILISSKLNEERFYPTVTPGRYIWCITQMVESDRPGQILSGREKMYQPVSQSWSATTGIGLESNQPERFLLKSVNASATGRLRMNLWLKILRSIVRPQFKVAHFKFGIKFDWRHTSIQTFKCSSFHWHRQARVERRVQVLICDY